MVSFSGTQVNTGIAIAKTRVMKNDISPVRKASSIGPAAELERLRSASAAVIDKLNRIKADTAEGRNSDRSGIIDTYIMMLSDSSDKSLLGRAASAIAANPHTSEYAVESAAESMAGEMRSAGSGYLQARNEDIIYIKDLVLRALSGKDRDTAVEEPSIIIAESVSPVQLTSFDPGMIKGLVTVKGSPLSHTAILAKNMNIPYITDAALDPDKIESGVLSVLDAPGGRLIYGADEQTVSEMREKMEQLQEEMRSFEEDAGPDLSSGSGVRLFANIGRPEEAGNAMKYHAQGVGLFRSEFLYIDSAEVPDEEAQYRAYMKALDTMEGRPVIVRTIDLGADKQSRCVPLPDEENPALGMRGIRISFEYPELFTTQLRALLRAAYKRNLRIMFPMISSAWEIEKAKKAVSDAAESLRREGIPCDIPPIGIMVETPAAALTLDKLADLIDFVSIGTNDLTQYTIAADRYGEGNQKYFDPRHEAVIRLIEITAESAHAKGIEVGICGALSSDTSLTEEFLRIGIDELSMPPSDIPAVAAKIREIRSGSKDICSPVDGYLIPMEDIGDGVFSEGVMGPCIGIYPSSGTVTAPFDGTVSMVAKTKHAVSVKSPNGNEVLIHAGLDTVNLKGRGFDCKVAEGQTVKSGEELITFDIDLIRSEGYSPLVVVVKLS